MTIPVVDAWMQHPTQRHLNDAMFDSAALDRHGCPGRPPPVRSTLDALAEGGVELGITSAWYGPTGPLISNDEVAGFVADSGDRLQFTRMGVFPQAIEADNSSPRLRDGMSRWGAVLSSHPAGPGSFIGGEPAPRHRAACTSG